MEIIRNSVQTEYYCLYGVFFLHAPNVCAIINEKNMCSIKKRGGDVWIVFGFRKKRHCMRS